MATQQSRKPVTPAAAGPRPVQEVPQQPRWRLKHGMYSSRAIIPGESEAEFIELRHDMIQELLPEGPVEGAYVDQMVLAQWRLRRLWSAQSGVYRHTGKAVPRPAVGTFDYPEHVARCVRADNLASGDLHRMSAEETRLVNIFHKAAKALDLRQGLRLRRLIRNSRPEQADPVLHMAPDARGFLERALPPRPSASSDAPSGNITEVSSPAAPPAEPPAETRVPPIAVVEALAPDTTPVDAPQAPAAALDSDAADQMARLRAEDDQVLRQYAAWVRKGDAAPLPRLSARRDRDAEKFPAPRRRAAAG